MVKRYAFHTQEFQCSHCGLREEGQDFFLAGVGGGGNKRKIT